MKRLNYSVLKGRKRSIRRERTIRKTLILLLRKEKSDKRTYRNLKKVFEFLAAITTFTGPQISKNQSIAGSTLYPLLDLLKTKKLIQKCGTKVSRGRGKTDIYEVTTSGRIVTAYVIDSMAMFQSALKEIMEKEKNPLKRFCLEAFIENYSTRTMKAILGSSMNRAATWGDSQFDIPSFVTELTQNAFNFSKLLGEEKESQEIFRKNAELLEKSEHREFIFLYFKMQLESQFLSILQGEKLSEFAKALKIKPHTLHVPCDNSDCTDVLLVDSFLQIRSPTFCEKCVTTNFNS